MADPVKKEEKKGEDMEESDMMFLKFEDPLLPVMKKDAMTDDLWIVMRERLIN